MRISITLTLALSIGTALGCAAKRPAVHHLTIENVRCEQNSEGGISCNCDNPQSVIDARDPHRATFRCQ